MSSFGRRAFPKRAPEVTQTRFAVETSTKGTPRSPLVPPHSYGPGSNNGTAAGGSEDNARIMTGDHGHGRMPRAVHVYGTPEEVRNRQTPGLYEYDSAEHAPSHPGQRAAVPVTGETINRAPITTRDYPPLGELPEESAVAYLAPKSHRRRSIPVEQLADKSDARPMPVDENGSQLERS